MSFGMVREDRLELLLSNRFSKVATPDLGIARRAIEKLHGPFQTHQPGLREHGDVDIRAARCGQVAVGSFSFGRTIGIVPKALADAIVVTTATRGMAAIDIAGQTFSMVTGATVIAHEEDAPVFRYAPDTEVLKVRFHRSRLEDFHARTRGRAGPGQRLRFDTVLDDPDTSARWLALLAFVVTTMNASLRKAPSAGELDALDNMLMLTLLESQPHNYAGSPALLATDGASCVFRRAIGFIEQHLASDIGLDDIAAAACCSPRTLARAFKQAGEIPPMRYVHKLRLERIRVELLSRASGRTVAEIAFAWGYRHLGEFNRQYRAAFGETPSQTRGGLMTLAS